jgi:hypothetical protein
MSKSTAGIDLRPAQNSISLLKMICMLPPNGGVESSLPVLNEQLRAERRGA